jgi:hypothetical protein
VPRRRFPAPSPARSDMEREESLWPAGTSRSDRGANQWAIRKVLYSNTASAL